MINSETTVMETVSSRVQPLNHDFMFSFLNDTVDLFIVTIIISHLFKLLDWLQFPRMHQRRRERLMTDR